jgi:hypothetical protein
MHVHLPKPLHGWRAFVGEVGIIVVGVLIALGAEQLAEGIHERCELAHLRDALRSELADDRARWEDIRGGDQCAEMRLKALEQWLRTAPAGARVNDAYLPFIWNMHTSAWDSAKFTPAGQLLALDERLTYAGLYDSLDNWRAVNADESKNAETINADFASADQPDSRRQLPQLLALARTKLKARQQKYSYLFTRFDELKIAADKSKLTLTIDQKAMCEPLGH